MTKDTIKYKALIAAIVVLLALVVVPTFNEHDQRMAFAILIFAAIMWFTEAVPLAITGLSIPFLAMLLGLKSPQAALIEFSNPILFLFMGGFVLAGALSTHGLDVKLVSTLVRAAKGNFYRSAIFLMLASALLGCWISNTSSTALMLPLALGMIALSKQVDFTNESRFLMLGIAYSASIGGVITMIGSPPNALGAHILKINFTEWLTYSVPLFLITFPIMILILTLVFKPDRKMQITDVFGDKKLPESAKKVYPIFGLIALLWAFEGVLAPILGITSGFSGMVGLLAVILVFVFKILTWEQIRTAVQWDILMLFGGGLTLGMLISDSGLGTTLISGVAHLVTKVPLLIFIWIIVAFCIILTEFMSNTATAAILLPLLYTLALQLNINPALLVLPATIAVSYGFMLPVGTPPNAMVYATGLVPQREMMSVGFLLNVVFSFIVTLILYVMLA